LIKRKFYLQQWDETGPLDSAVPNMPILLAPDDMDTWWNYNWHESLCATNPTQIMLPLRFDLCGQQMAQTAQGMTPSARVGNGQITETATRVPALSSRTPALTFCFQIQPDFVIIQSVVMPISRTDHYGSYSGAFFECCQQNKTKKR